jgi:Transmembrane family 220, helix
MTSLRASISATARQRDSRSVAATFSAEEPMAHRVGMGVDAGGGYRDRHAPSKSRLSSRAMATPRRWFHYVSWLMAALYLVSVALQYNDPDPLRWMAIYGAAALASLCLPTQRWAAPLALAVAAVALVWAALLLPDIVGVVSFTDLWRKMSEKGGAVEIEREVGGLIIVVGWMVAGAVLARRAHRRP